MKEGRLGAFGATNGNRPLALGEEVEQGSEYAGSRPDDPRALAAHSSSQLLPTPGALGASKPPIGGAVPSPHRIPSRGRSRLTPSKVWVTLTAAVLFTGLVLGLPPGVRADPHSADTAVFINISANPALSFAPDSFSVPPGTTVHLVITQMSDFNHTFTLASVVNDTIASGTTPTQLAAFFHQHPPIVNVSLGPTVGEQYPVEFIAPATLGSYEFLCLIHFPTMTGTMTVGSPSSSSTTTSLGWIEYAGIGAAGAIVLVAIGVLIWSRARHKGPSAGVPPTGM